MKKHSSKLNAPDMCDEDIEVFKKILLRTLHQEKHYEILEWGAGFSTAYFGNYIDRSGIKFHWQSVENELRWKHKAETLSKHDNLDIELIEYPLPEGEDRRYYKKVSTDMTEYVKFPSTLNKKFDFIFIDGYKRRDCLEEALTLLKENGTVIVHDAERPKYWDKFGLFDGRFIGDKLWIGKLKQVKPVPVVMVYNNKREELVNQTVTTLGNTNSGCDIVLYTKEDEIGDDNNYIKIRNQLIKDIPFDYNYLVYCDDDLFFCEGWLKKMIKEMKRNPDVWILGGISYHGHNVVEKREGININDNVIPGGLMLFRKDTWDKVGPFDESVVKTRAICQRVIDNGGKVGVMKNKELVLHCGINSILNKNGFGPETISEIKRLANKIGAKTND